MLQIVDREREQVRLADMLAKGTPQLALMYGRRRVGKTHLLTHTWPTSTRLFYFTAAETTAGQNRAALLESIQRFTGETLDPSAFGAWRNIFRLLLEMEGSHPLVVVLDEFQYFGDGTEQGLRDVASQLNAEWEAQRPARALVFVLCGSAIRLIEALNTGGSPLYGRFEWVCQLEPFDYWHAAQMVPYQSLRARAATYAVFGGTPRYLASIDKRLAEAVDTQNPQAVARLKVRPRPFIWLNNSLNAIPIEFSPSGNVSPYPLSVGNVAM